eukprot:SAG31_NODE_1549_length_7913_cov_8.822882_2_plen_208_part_00
MAAPQMAAPQMAAMMAAPQMAAPQMAGFLAARSSLTEALTRTHGCADAGAGEAAAAGPAVSRGEAMHALRELRRLVGGEDPALRLKPERGVDAGAATTTEGSPAVSPLQSPAPGASLAGSDEEQPVLVSANRRTMPGAPGAKGKYLEISRNIPNISQTMSKSLREQLRSVGSSADRKRRAVLRGPRPPDHIVGATGWHAGGGAVQRR